MLRKNTRMKKIICSMLIITAIIAGIGTIPVQAANAPVDYVAGHPTYENNLLKGMKIFENEAPVNAENRRIQALPAKYDPRETGMVPTHIEDQGNYNVCWAFSAIAAMECNLIKNGYVNANVNLSENFLAYFFYNRQTDPLGGTLDDKNIAEMNTWDQNGGTIQGTAIFLTTWAGVIKDTENTGDVYVPKDLRDEDSYDVDYHVKNTYFYNYSVENVKNAILDHGAVASGIYIAEKYWNFNECAYYCPEKNGNHAVTIVGWDDSYGKENFKEEPENDGAWIVRNSYGSGGYLGDGYLYVSYEDASLDEIVAYEMIKTSEDYTHNYQYDGSGNPAINIRFDENTKIANTFVAQGSQENCNEELHAVSIGLLSTWTDYNLEIYAGITEGGNPTDGTLVFTQTGVLKDAGNQQIELEHPVELIAGERYAVVFSFKNDDNVMIALDCSLDAGWIGFENQVENGQGYHNEGSAWMDLNEPEDGDPACNLRIKAYTNNTEQKTTLTLDKTFLSLEEGSVEELSAAITPANIKRDILWISADESIAVVEDGTVTAIKTGSTTITAAVGNMTAYCEVKVCEDKNTNEGGNVNNDGNKTPTTNSTSSQRKEKLSNTSNAKGKASYTGDNSSVEKTIICTVVALCILFGVRNRNQFLRKAKNRRKSE